MNRAPTCRGRSDMQNRTREQASPGEQGEARQLYTRALPVILSLAKNLSAAIPASLSRVQSS